MCPIYYGSQIFNNFQVGCYMLNILMNISQAAKDSVEVVMKNIWEKVCVNLMYL